MLLRLALRESWNHRRFSSFFIANLFLGFFGFLALDAFKASLAQSLAARSRLLLAADVVVSARRELTSNEQKLLQQSLPASAQTTTVTELFSMVSAQSKRSRLAEVVAVGDGYPFYGDWRLLKSGTVDGSRASRLLGDKQTWIDQELAAQLNVQMGDTLMIGKTSVVVTDIVQSHTATGGRGFLLASRVYLRPSTLKETALVRFGSTVSYRQLVRLPPSVDSEALADQLNRAISDPGIRITSHQKASQQVGRLQGFLNDYLGLASLVSLFLAAVGAGYLFRSFLIKRLKEIAVLRSLGLSPLAAQSLYIIQLIFLGMIAACLSLLISYLVLPLVIRAIGSFVATPVDVVIPFKSLALAVFLGSIGSVLTCLPFLIVIPTLKPADLFQENLSSSPNAFIGELPVPRLGPRGMTIVASFLPGLLVYWLLAVIQAKSWRVGSLFTGVFLLSGGVLFAVAWFGLTRLPNWARRAAAEIRLAARSLARDRLGSGTCFLAIGLGTLLMTLIPQIQKSLAQEVAQPNVSSVPSLFVFDIQDEEVEPLTTFLKDRGHPLSSVTPMLRGRLMSVNDAPFEKDVETAQGRTREEENQTRFRNRGFNLTYRTSLSESEKIVKGKNFSGQGPTTTQDGILEGEVSIEQRFAKRLDFHIGDRLTFDVQGIPVIGRVVNFRQVEWTSFQPNFFVQFQPGLLEDAPKAWLGSIARLPADERGRLQGLIVEQFPNISLIDVSSVIEKLLAIFSQMAWAIRWMAILSILAGLVVLFSIASHQAYQRRGDFLLLKILGAGHSSLTRMVNWEFGFLGLSAAASGAAVSIVVSYFFSKILFDQVWALDWLTPLASILLVTGLGILTARIAVRPVLLEKPIQLLSES